MEEECSHSAAAEKAAPCHPILKLAASCHCLTCWHVLVSPHITVRRQLRLADEGWLSPGHVPAVSSISSRSSFGRGWYTAPKGIRDLLWLWGHCSKSSESRNGMFRETLKTSTGNRRNFIRILPQISSSSRAGILKELTLIIICTLDVGISIQLLMPSRWQYLEYQSVRTNTVFAVVCL